MITQMFCLGALSVTEVYKVMVQSNILPFA